MVAMESIEDVVVEASAQPASAGPEPQHAPREREDLSNEPIDESLLIRVRLAISCLSWISAVCVAYCLF